MELNLRGKKCLISGGSRGIGLAIKKALEKEGVEVISWSRSEGVDLMQEVVPIPEIDFLIYNAGGGGTWTNERDQMEINYFAMLECIHQILGRKHIKRVITISSIYGKEKGHNPGFTASKASQIAYMKSLAGRYKGVTFNTICPGYIDVGKPFHKDAPINYMIKQKSKIGKPEDVANLVVFLCSDKSSHINGATITVDGEESHSF